MRKERRERKKTDEIPAIVLDGGELGLVDDGPYKVGECSGGDVVEEEVEGETVAGVVAEVVELPEGLEEPVEGVLAGTEGQDGVEGGEGAPAGGEDEKVGWAIWDEAGGGGGCGKVAGEEGMEGVVEGVGGALVAVPAVEGEGEIEEDGEEEQGLGDERWAGMSAGREGKKRLTRGSEYEETPAKLESGQGRHGEEATCRPTTTRKRSQRQASARHGPGCLSHKCCHVPPDTHAGMSQTYRLHHAHSRPL